MISNNIVNDFFLGIPKSRILTTISVSRISVFYSLRQTKNAKKNKRYLVHSERLI